MAAPPSLPSTTTAVFGLQHTQRTLDTELALPDSTALHQTSSKSTRSVVQTKRGWSNDDTATSQLQFTGPVAPRSRSTLQDHQPPSNNMTIEDPEDGSPAIWAPVVCCISKAVRLHGSPSNTIESLRFCQRFFTGVACHTSLKPRYSCFSYISLISHSRLSISLS